MDNEDNAEARWNNFLETAYANLFRYFHEYFELRKLMIEARDRVDYEHIENVECEHDLGETDQWMVAGQNFPRVGQKILSQPLVDPKYEWHEYI